MDTLEQLAVWYVRLNGYFATANFIAHGRGGPRTDVDVLAVRFPYSSEYPDDTERLQIPDGKVDFILAEAKAGMCCLNGPWKAGGDRQALEYVLKRVGVLDGDAAVARAAQALYGTQRYEGRDYAVRIVCFGARTNQELPEVTQILWPDAISFIHRRFHQYRADKADHQHWDSFGRYLWGRLAGDGIPTIGDIVAGWKGRCPCRPE